MSAKQPRLINCLWASSVEPVTLIPGGHESWLLRAYLAKHGGRWLRYRDESERQTKYTSPALGSVKLWAEPAIREAKERAWDERGEGENHFEALARIAYSITQRGDYPMATDLEELWFCLNRGD